ncbi:MAG: GNAT family N-acetyltransferase [Clostridiales bacterium]|jgi:aminoglycoside 6'-N-acetyltransferase I|nr:GNAT family N-acetyltransferase [Clostridiales bacterium]
MIIRGLKEKDISACADILCAVYNNESWMCRWPKEKAEAYLRDFYNHGKFVGYVAEDNGNVIAALFAHEKVWWNNDEVFIDEMFVKPEYQGKGIGTALLAEVEKYIRKKGLAGITLATNKYVPAPKFYEKNGFINCEHVIFMAKVMEN